MSDAHKKRGKRPLVDGNPMCRIISVRLNQQQSADLDTAAALAGTPPSTFARDAIVAAVARVLKRSQR